MNQNRFSDSAGVPWDGRSFDSNEWSNDDGSANPELIETICRAKRGQALAEDVVNAIRGTRVLIPLLANLGESEISADGLKLDKSAELSIVTVQTPDLQSGLPIFSSTDSMRAWNSDARPVPVDIAKAALAAAKENNTRLILDPANESEFVFRRAAIQALATQKQWTHPIRSDAVRTAFTAAVGEINEIVRFELQDGDPRSELESAEVLLILQLQTGLDREQIDALMQSLAHKISQSFEIAEEVDSLRVKLAAAD